MAAPAWIRPLLRHDWRDATTLLPSQSAGLDNCPVDMDEFADDYYLTDDLTDQAIGNDQGPARQRFPSSRSSCTSLITRCTDRSAQGRRSREIPRPLRRRLGRDPRAAVTRGSSTHGLFPEGTPLPPRNVEAARFDVPAWDSLTRRAARGRAVHGGVRGAWSTTSIRVSAASSTPSRNSASSTTPSSSSPPTTAARRRAGRRAPAATSASSPTSTDCRRLGARRGARPRAHRRSADGGALPARVGQASNTPFRLYKATRSPAESVPRC